MKKLANTFLKVGKILALVCAIACTVASVIYLISAIVATAQVALNDADSSLIGKAIGGFIKSSIYIGLGIFDFVVTNRTQKVINEVKSKEEFKNQAILNIVSGVLCSQFSAAACIIMLAAPETVYTADQEVNDSVSSQSVESAEVVDEQPQDIQ